jgi:ABC-type transport system substrate-binding protein
VRLAAVELRIDADLGLGRDAELINELQALVTEHPLRERFWAQLMLALYRSGRQGEALDGYDRARRTLADQLGVDPGPGLQLLQRQILDHDSALESATTSATATAASEPPSPPQPADASGPPHMPNRAGSAEPGLHPSRHRLAAIGVAVAIIAAALVGNLVFSHGESAGTPRATYRPGTVLVNVTTGKEVGFIPKARLEESAYPIFSGGHFWVVDFSPSAFVEIDPSNGRIMRQVSPPTRDPKVRGDSHSLTLFTVQGNALWAVSGDDVVQMDIALDREVNRFRLDHYVRGPPGLAEGVALGGGSVWVSRDVGTGQVLRLNPVTGKVEHRFDNLPMHEQLSYGDGSLWIADERGIARIDAATNELTRVDGIKGSMFVVAGGGFGWTSGTAKGLVYKIDQTGQLAATYPVGLGDAFMSYANGRLWVGAGDPGTVTGIDGATGKTTTYRFGHPVETITAGGDVVLAMLDSGPTVEGFFNSFQGRVAKFFADSGELGLGDEAALDPDQAAYQIEYATCAKLLNYPDRPTPGGLQLQPEVARAMPTVSRGGRTYTFAIRPGYRFSPPSNQPVTAETFRYSIERALSPKLASYPYQHVPPGPQLISDIEGERAFRRGAATHISGLRAHGDTLSITLTRPSPDFLERLTTPFFCPVPIGTPFVPGGPHQGGTNTFIGGYIDSAGPYYVQHFANERWVILKRNSNYHGPRPHALDVIAIREGVAASAALDRVQNGGWDGITSMTDPLLVRGGPLDQHWGAISASRRQRYFLAPLAATRFLAFNTQRGVFADPRVRRAASLALDRNALAAVWGDAPTDQLLSPALPDARLGDSPPPSPSIAKASALMRGRGGRAVMPVVAGCVSCLQTAHLVHTALAKIGITVLVRTVGSTSKGFSHEGSFDLLDARTEILYPDSASFLTQALQSIPEGWVPAAVQARIQRLASSTGNHRQTGGAKMARRLTANDAVLAVYSTPQVSEFFSPRLGCRIFPPFGYGVDFAALCPPG